MKPIAALKVTPDTLFGEDGELLICIPSEDGRPKTLSPLNPESQTELAAGEDLHFVISLYIDQALEVLKWLCVFPFLELDLRIRDADYAEFSIAVNRVRTTTAVINGMMRRWQGTETRIDVRGEIEDIPQTNLYPRTLLVRWLIIISLWMTLIPFWLIPFVKLTLGNPGAIAIWVAGCSILVTAALAHFNRRATFLMRYYQRDMDTLRQLMVMIFQEYHLQWLRPALNSELPE